MTGLRLSRVKRRSISSAKVYQKTDSHSITVPLFFNKILPSKSIKKDVPDYQAHPEFLIFEFCYDAIKRCIPTNARIIRILASTKTKNQHLAGC